MRSTLLYDNIMLLVWYCSAREILASNVDDETTRRIELLAAGGQMNFENDCGSVSNGAWVSMYCA